MTCGNWRLTAERSHFVTANSGSSSRARSRARKTCNGSTGSRSTGSPPDAGFLQRLLEIAVPPCGRMRWTVAESTLPRICHRDALLAGQLAATPRRLVPIPTSSIKRPHLKRRTSLPTAAFMTLCVIVAALFASTATLVSGLTDPTYEPSDAPTVAPTPNPTDIPTTKYPQAHFVMKR